MFKKQPYRPTLQPNRKKIVESILFLIEEAEHRGTHVTTYDIVKSIFVADVSHLNTYGRPVTFDNYYAMKDGPVPSDAYNMLLDEPYEFAKEVEGWPLWHKESSPQDGANVFKYVRPKRSPNKRVLSDTDISALTASLSIIKAQTFSDTRDMTHEYAAYKEAWEARGDKQSVHMSYELLIDTKDADVASDVAHASHYA